MTVELLIALMGLRDVTWIILLTPVGMILKMYLPNPI